MLEKIGPVIGFIVLISYTLACVIAFSDGIEAWTHWHVAGWRAFAVAGAFIVIAMLRLTFLTLPLVFYGAWKGWGLTWWQAGIFTMPTLMAGLVLMLGGGVIALWENWTRRRQRPHQ